MGTPEEDPPARLEVRCLGGLSVRIRGEPLPVDAFPYDKVRALFAYLAVEPEQGHSRGELAARLWPDSSEVEARRNLRHALHTLRQSLGSAAEYLHADRQLVALRDGEGGLFIDARVLQGAAELGRANSAGPGAAREQLWQGLHAYAGPLLEGVELPGLEHWRREAAGRLLESARSLARLLTEVEEAAGRSEAAVTAARRWVDLAADDESAHYQLVRLLLQRGEREVAWRRFEQAVRTLSPAGGKGASERLEGLRRELEEHGAEEEDPTLAAVRSHPERRSAQVLYAWPASAAVAPQAEECEALFQRLTATLQGYGAHVVPEAAPGLLAYFGYPVAREEAARQAVQAGRALVSLTGGEGGAVQVGIEAGPVLARSDRPYPQATGATTRQAVELARQARPGEVLVGPGLEERVRGFFQLQPADEGPQGAGSEEAPFRVEGETGATHRFAARIPPVRDELVGREGELDTLLQHWREAAAGSGRMLTVGGEAGVGKTRLIHALLERVASEGGAVREGRCQPETTARPYYPVADLMRGVLGLGADASQAVQWQALQEYLAGRPGSVEGAEDALSRLLGLRSPDPERDERSADSQRRQLAEVLSAILEEQASEAPVVLVLEDFQWADPSTRELLASVRARLEGLPVLLVVSARRDNELPTGSDMVLHLDPLPPQDTRQLALNIAPEELTPQELARVVQHSGGVPLFIEELARVSAGEASTEGGVPTTLRDLLLARLDRLGPAKRTAQVAALVGHLLDRGLLATVLRREMEGVEEDLSTLAEADILAPCLDSGAGFYRWRHELVREAVAGSVTAEERRFWHGRIGEALLDPDAASIVGLDVAQAAEHLSEGGYAKEAVARFREAGEKALVEGALEEAERLLERGLTELDGLTGGPGRDSREVGLRMGLGKARMARQGYGATGVDATFRRALELVVPAERSERVFVALWGLWLSASSRSGYGEARGLAERMQALAEDLADDRFRLAAHMALGNTLLWQGELDEARRHQLAARHLCPEASPAGLIARFGEDPRATNLAFLSWSEWLQGREAAADEAIEEARRLALRGGHPHTWAYVRTFEAILAFFRRAPAVGLAPAAEVVAVAEREGLSLWQAAGSALLGWARAGSGDPGGVEQIRRSLDLMHRAMEGVGSIFLVWLADSQVGMGLPDDALDTLDAVEESMGRIGDAFLSPEVERLRGEAHWQRQEPEAARQSWQQALDRARYLAIPALEARAENSLNRTP